LAKTYSILINFYDAPRCTRLTFVAGSGEPMCFSTRFRNRKGAADYLSEQLDREITVNAMARMASKGVGPGYAIVLGRATYPTAGLDEWLEEQTRPPPRERDCPLTQPADDEGSSAPAAA
jgi:hypothetical protein